MKVNRRLWREANTPLFIHDKLLGHVPNPGFSTSGFGNSFHTIDANGLRYSGLDPGNSDDGPILAVGNSYTYGDEVRDEEAWPAQLQALTGRRVLNGGVTGYGFDQMVLRAEHLIKAHKPSLVIVGFISDNVARTEMRSMWWRDKPWFAIEKGQLVLKGVPVPDRTMLPPEVKHRLHGIMLRLPWLAQTLVGYHSRIHPVGHGLVLVQRLVERVAGYCVEHRVGLIVMAQYEPWVWRSRASAKARRGVTATVLECAAAHGAATLDTYQRFASEPDPLAFYGVSHMNARGNRSTAALLAATLPALVASQTVR